MPLLKHVAGEVFRFDFLGSFLHDLRQDFDGYDNQTVEITEDDIAGADFDATAFDRATEIDDHRAAGRIDRFETGGKNREAHFDNGLRIAGIAVDDATGAAAGAGGGGEQLAPVAGAGGLVGAGNHAAPGGDGVDGGDFVFVGIVGPLIDIGAQHGMRPADHAHPPFDRADAGVHGLFQIPMPVEHIGN